MSDKHDHNPHDSLMDTQQLLQGLEPGQDSDFDLEDILAEYGVSPSPAVPKEAPEPVRKSDNILPFPGTYQENSNDLPSAPVEEMDHISAEELFDLPTVGSDLPVSADELDDEAEGSSDEEVPTEEEGGEFVPLTMEDIVASTVDAVKEDQKRHQDQMRKKMERERKKLARERKKDAPKPVKRRRQPAIKSPVPQTEEPPAGDSASWHKRWYGLCRKNLLIALPVLAVLWLPSILERVGVSLSFLSSIGNTSLYTLIVQVVLCVICWPVFHRAAQELQERSCTFYFLVTLSNLVTILDEVTLLLLPGRTQALPLGGVAATTAVFFLWGLTSYHKGMWESFRTASMGQPTYLVDVCSEGIAKGRGTVAGFYNRIHMEDTSSQWQRLLLPVMVTASVVLTILSSIGQGRGQDFFWCWSVSLCAGTSLVCPLTYFVPFGRLAARLSRSGAAVAGQYGASAIDSFRQLVVTDSDLFPHGTVTLSGLKLYGEERDHAISYTASLAVLGGGCLAHIFESLCRSDRIPYQNLEHFHIHDDGGLSGIIHGETVLVGPPIFMRHRGVRLPATMPAKTAVCLAVDGTLTAVFSVKYTPSAPVKSSLHALSRNKLHLALATRDGNITPKLLKARFGTDGGAVVPEIGERLNLSDPQREGGEPNALLYRTGLFPYVEIAAGSHRLCHTVRIGNLLCIMGSIFGILLAFYITFTGSYSVLSPLLLAVYLLLWIVPMIPLLWSADRS